MTRETMRCSGNCLAIVSSFARHMSVLPITHIYTVAGAHSLDPKMHCFSSTNVHNCDTCDKYSVFTLN